jgi:succinate dehydrogenase / fumarate reductase cytochrome b subunit
MRFTDAKSTMQTKKRPVFLALHQISLPLTGFISIAHRVTGLLLFFLIPVVLYLLQHSLATVEGFAEVRQWLQGWPARVALVMAAWWFAHHLFAGLRFLLIDCDIGVGLSRARDSARLVLLGGIVVLLVSAVGAI